MQGVGFRICFQVLLLSQRRRDYRLILQAVSPLPVIFVYSRSVALHSRFAALCSRSAALCSRSAALYSRSEALYSRSVGVKNEEGFKIRIG